MHELIERLVNQRKEGLWWDFKREHHLNKADLLHDVLCLANIIHSGDRYIIFGVSDDYEIIGLSDQSQRRKQADIIDYFRAKRFANHNAPTIKLETIFIEDKQLDILVIKDERTKQFYLIEDEFYKGVSIRAGVIYARQHDSNTAKNGCANPKDIESMWRERFGLDQKASDRFRDILLDYNNWQYDGVSKAYYELDPDYTIEIGNVESIGGKYWWEEGLHEKPAKYFYSLKFKSTELHSLLVVHYRNECLKFPFPDVEFVTYPERNDGLHAEFYCDLFFYNKNSLEFAMLKHMRARERSEGDDLDVEMPLKTQQKPPVIKLPFLIFDSDEAAELICAELRENFGNFEELITKSKVINNIADEGQRRYALERRFSEWAFDLANK